MTTDLPSRPRAEYPVVDRDDSVIRAFKDDVLSHLGKPLVDVRSPGEYSGELLHMPDYPQEARCAADTSAVRPTCRGRPRPTTTGRSKASTS